MKVFFNATPSRLDEYKHKYSKIGEILVKHNHKFTSKWILEFNKSFYEAPRETWSKHYLEIKDRLLKSDVVVIDVSVSSTTAGMMIYMALINKKPVIALTDKSYTNQFLEGAGDVESKLLVVEYSLDNIEQKLTDALDYVEDWLESRFTMILDGQTRKTLDEISKTGISRSDYIRNLIKKDVENRKSK